jgi:hypothetical protein
VTNHRVLCQGAAISPRDVSHVISPPVDHGPRSRATRARPASVGKEKQPSAGSDKHNESPSPRWTAAARCCFTQSVDRAWASSGSRRQSTSINGCGSRSSFTSDRCFAKSSFFCTPDAGRTPRR